MKYLSVKLFRDFRELWAQFLSVFMMALISLAIFVGLSSAWTGMQQITDQYYSETNLSDLWVNATNITKKRMDRLKANKGITKAEPSMMFEIKYEKDDTKADINVCTFNHNTESVLSPLPISGKKLNSRDKGIWLDKDFANAHNLKPQDKITVKLQEKEIKIKVLGVVLDPEYMYMVTSSDESVPNHDLHGYAYLNEKTVLGYLPAISYNNIRIRMANQSNQADIIKDIEKIFKKDVYSVLNRKDRIEINQVTEEILQIKRMAILFSFIFILLSVLTMYTTMSRLITNQINLIGIMKAIGFNNRQLYLHYGLYGVSVSLLGGLPGIVIGRAFIAERILAIKRSTITLPRWYGSISYEAIVLLGTIVLICTLAAILTVKKALKMTPGESLRGELPDSKNSCSITESSNSAYEWKWVIRDALENKMRYAIGVIAVMGSLTLMVAGVGIHDSIHKANDDVFSKQYRYDNLLIFNNRSLAELKKDFKGKEVQFFEVKRGVIKLKKSNAENNEDENIVITHLGRGSYVRLTDAEDNSVKLKGKEAVITGKLAAKIGVKKGDFIKYKYLNSSELQRIKISAVVTNGMPQGLFMRANADGSGFTPANGYISGSNVLDKARHSDAVKRIISITEQRRNIDGLMDSVNTIIYILILASFLLSFVILYNLGMVNYVERSRQYATMKVLGFHMNELRRLVLKDCALTIVPGYILGIPLSLKFLDMYVQGVSFENIEWKAYITGLHFVIISIVVIAFSIFINLLIVGKVKRIKMVQALKSVE